MAEIILGIGASHSPLLTLNWTEWQHRAQADYENLQLNLSDGRLVSYAALVAEVGEPYAPIATPEEFQSLAAKCQAALDRLADELAAADPDLVVIVGDDQGELLSPASMPAIAIYYGDELFTNNIWGRNHQPGWMREMARGYAMDRVRRFPAAPQAAQALIAGLIEGHVDVGAVARIEDPEKAGFGHAFGFIIEKLFRGRSIPVLPVLLNTYFPPNVMTAARAHDIGKAIRAVLESDRSSARIAIVASGGLSHFVVDEALDRRVLEGLKAEKAELLRTIPRGALNSGSSEILNWVMTAGAVQQLPLDWVDFQPIRRTPAGTGIGVAFACWKRP